MSTKNKLLLVSVLTFAIFGLVTLNIKPKFEGQAAPKSENVKLKNIPILEKNNLQIPGDLPINCNFSPQTMNVNDAMVGEMFYEEGKKVELSYDPKASTYHKRKYFADKDRYKKYECAYHYLKIAASLGHIEAMARLGAAFERGSIVPRNYETSLFWNKKAAGNGSVDAIKNLGFAYENGLGVTKDLKLAMNLYRRAAHRHSATAARHLGKLLLTEPGVSRPSEGVQWLKFAASYNDAASAFILGNWLRERPTEYERVEAVFYLLLAKINFSENGYYHKLANDRIKLILPTIRRENIEIVNRRIHFHNFSSGRIDHENFEDMAFTLNSLNQFIELE